MKKILENDWKCIRYDREHNGLSFTELAQKYDVNRSAIYRKAKSEQWYKPSTKISTSSTSNELNKTKQDRRKKETDENMKDNSNQDVGGKESTYFDPLGVKDFATVSFQSFHSNNYADDLVSVYSTDESKHRGKYQNVFARIAYHIGLLGGTYKNISQAFGVSEQTIHNWMNRYPEFKMAWMEGRELGDLNVADSLYRSAIGYHLTISEPKIVNGKVLMTVKTKHYPPNITAAMYWLNNRQPHLWSSKPESEPEIPQSILDPDEKEKLYETVLKEAEEEFRKVENRAERLGLKLDKDEAD